MKYLLWLAVGIFTLLYAQESRAQDAVTLIAPAGIRCVVDRLSPEFERSSGHPVKSTIGSGGGTHQRVVRGEVFDVSIVQPPYEDVIASGNVVAATETPLATVPIVVIVRKSDPKPDISTPDAVKKLLLAAKAISYPDPAGGASAGVSFDETQKKLGIYEEMKPKIVRKQGVSMVQLLTSGDIDVGLAFPTGMDDPALDIVGELPREISTPIALVGFVSSHAASPDTAKALLAYLAAPQAAAAYKACAMTPGR